MMMEDEMSLMQCVTSTAGRSQVVIQKPLPMQTRMSIEMEIAKDDPNQSMIGLTLHKDFQNCHLNYQNQGVHMLSYMQSISETLHAGWHLTYAAPPMAPAPTAKMSYGVKWNPEP